MAYERYDLSLRSVSLSRMLTFYRRTVRTEALVGVDSNACTVSASPDSMAVSLIAPKQKGFLRDLSQLGVHPLHD